MLQSICFTTTPLVYLPHRHAQSPDFPIESHVGIIVPVQSVACLLLLHKDAYWCRHVGKTGLNGFRGVRE